MSRTLDGAELEAGRPRLVRDVLVATIGLGGFGCAAALIGRGESTTAALLDAGSFSISGPAARVTCALVLLTVATAVAHTALSRWQLYRLRARRLVEQHQRVVSGTAEDPAGLAQADPVTTLSHEIRTPLNAIMGVAELLMSSRLDGGQRAQVDQLRRSAMVLLGLVDDALDRAVLGADQLVLEHQPFELADLLADAVELLQVEAATKGIRLQTELDPGCPRWLRGDAPRLRQVLVNLLGNAVKFTEDGLVTVEVCRAARTEQPGALYFQVTDTGTGIPADQLTRVFEPYARVSPTDQPRRRGAGLGLSISQALVKGMGGEIAATSQEGVGSAFGFELVLPPEPAPATVAAALGRRRILLLDRLPLRAAQTADELRGWGAEVEVAHPQHWCAGTSDLVVVLEDHPDQLADLGARLRRSSAARPPLLLVTASAHAVPADALTADDLVIGPATAGRRLRAALTSLGRARPSSAKTPEPDVDERPLRVLLAEDDPTSRQVCETLVRLLGHDVDVVADGAAAVRAASSASYDLVLMDSKMPELDGVEATRAIRAGEAGGRRVRVVALTGAVTAADRESYASAGMDGLLEKPLTRARLADVLTDVPRRHDGPIGLVPRTRRGDGPVLRLAS